MLQKTMHHTATHWQLELQGGEETGMSDLAVCCSVLQCVAVRCSVLQMLGRSGFFPQTSQ